MNKLLYLLLLLALVSCGAQIRKDEGLLAQAEKLVSDSPDSALSVLEQIEKTAMPHKKRDKMKFLLLKTEAMNKAYLPLDSVAYMPKVLEYYKHHGTANERMRAYYMMGSIYRDKGDSPKALTYFRDAVSQSSDEGNNTDYALLSRIYTQMAALFEQQRYPQQEAPMWREAYAYAMKAKDTLTATHALNGQASVYWILNKKDSAVLVEGKTYEAYKKMGRDDLAAASLGAHIAYYLENDSIEKARLVIEEHVNRFGHIDKKDYVSSGGNVHFYIYLGRYYEKINKLDSALYFYRELTKSEDLENLENGYRGLMSAYRRLGKADSVYKYAELFANTNDSANAKNSATEISRTHALYNLTESQQVALEKTQQVARLRDTLYFLGFCALLAIVLLYYFVNRRRKREREQLQEANKKYYDVLSSYAKAQSELDSLRVDTADLVEKKEREIEKIKQEISVLQGESNLHLWDVEQKVLNSDIVMRMHRLASKIMTPSSSEWNDLMDLVEKSLPDFYAPLHNKDVSLTDKELKVCILTRLNFLSSELVVLLNLSKQRISNLRAGVNHKLFNEKSSTSLEANIRKL